MITLKEYISVMNKYPIFHIDFTIRACIGTEIIIIPNILYCGDSPFIISISIYDQLESDEDSPDKIVTNPFINTKYTDIQNFELAVEKFVADCKQWKKERRYKKIEEL